MPTEKTWSFCPCSRVLNRSGKRLFAKNCMTEHKHTSQTVPHNTGTLTKLFHTIQAHQSNCFTQYGDTNQTVSHNTGTPIKLFHTGRPAHINYILTPWHRYYQYATKQNTNNIHQYIYFNSVIIRLSQRPSSGILKTQLISRSLITVFHINK